jgi:putative SbcD/Mre11-related phosphoesterase
MDILAGIEIMDLALYVKKDNILIISDVHIGYEEALNKKGVLIPRFQFKEIIQRLDKIIDNKIFDKIIINGDVKHEFGTISEQEWRHTLRLLDFLKKYSKEIILVKGNHDKILGPIAKKRNVKVKDYLIIKDILIIHGDKDKGVMDLIKKNKIKKIIIGHEHPAVGLAEGSRVETYKCFLKGKWKNKTLIAQPSFNLVTEGTDVLKEALLSPFLKQDLGKFNVYIVSDKVYEFGKLKNLFINLSQ